MMGICYTFVKMPRFSPPCSWAWRGIFPLHKYALSFSCLPFFLEYWLMPPLFGRIARLLRKQSTTSPAFFVLSFS